MESQSMEIQKVNGAPVGMTAREGFGTTELQRTAETAVASVEARERARTNAMFIMAERHPRSWDTVRVKLLSHCARFGFSEKARYKKPAGRAKINGVLTEIFAEGLSARFAETARQEMGNLNTETSIVYEDERIRIVRATVIDLEHNTWESRELAIQKTVEKKGKYDAKSDSWEPPEGREVISTRINSYNEPVYLVKATDDETMNKQNSLISKATRDETLRLIPKDIRDDCERKIIEIVAKQIKDDPAAFRKHIIDNFASINVLPDDLQNYMMDVPIERCSPAQMEELRGLYRAIKDGELTFDEALKLKFQSRAEESKEDIVERKKAEILNQRKEELQQQQVKQEPAAQQAQSAPLTAEENQKLDQEIAAQDAERAAIKGESSASTPHQASQPKFGFGKKK